MLKFCCARKGEVISLLAGTMRRPLGRTILLRRHIFVDMIHGSTPHPVSYYTPRCEPGDRAQLSSKRLCRSAARCTRTVVSCMQYEKNVPGIYFPLYTIAVLSLSTSCTFRSVQAHPTPASILRATTTSVPPAATTRCEILTGGRPLSPRAEGPPRPQFFRTWNFHRLRSCQLLGGMLFRVKDGLVTMVSLR